MDPLKTTARITASCVVLSVVAWLMGCAGDASSDRPPDSYLVRGIVLQLPAAGRSEGEVHVRHEAIPEFKDADGAVIGMESMTMPFPVADPSLLAGIEIGSKVQMEFEVRWEGGHPLRITAIEELPLETRLTFEADEVAGAGEDDGASAPAPEPTETDAPR